MMMDINRVTTQIRKANLLTSSLNSLSCHSQAFSSIVG